MNRGHKNRHYKARRDTRRRAAGFEAWLAWGRKVMPKDADWCDGCREWVDDACDQCWTEGGNDYGQCVIVLRTASSAPTSTPK